MNAGQTIKIMDKILNSRQLLIEILESIDMSFNEIQMSNPEITDKCLGFISNNIKEWVDFALDSYAKLDNKGKEFMSIRSYVFKQLDK